MWLLSLENNYQLQLYKNKMILFHKIFVPILLYLRNKVNTKWTGEFCSIKFRCFFYAFYMKHEIPDLIFNCIPLSIQALWSSQRIVMVLNLYFPLLLFVSIPEKNSFSYSTIKYYLLIVIPCKGRKVLSTELDFELSHLLKSSR